MRVYIVTDLEGVGGVVLPKQVSEGHPMYEEARHLLTQEVNAAIEGALEVGAKEILVLDGHGANNAYNLLLEELREEAEVIVGSPWGSYPPCLKEGWDAILCIGFHCMAGEEGVLEHTMSSTSWVNAYINGKRVGELGLISAYAGELGIPVVLVTGDSVVCREARELLGDVETVAVKRPLSRTSAICLPPVRVRKLIKEATKRALGRVKEFKVLRFTPPITLRIEYLRTDMPKAHKGKEGIEVEERAINVRGNSVIEVIDKWWS